MLGSAGNVGSNQDYDIFRFSILANTVLSSITLDSYRPGSGVSFLGMQTGVQWTARNGSGINPISLAGWTLFGASNIGDELLTSMANAGQGTSGFSAPPGAGDYVFLVQDTGGSN